MNLLDPTNQNDPQIDPNLDPLEALTGPGGKFDKTKYTSESDMYKAIAKSKLEADMYIDHMKLRQDELRNDYTTLREQYNAGPKLQELLNQFNPNAQHMQSEEPNANDVKPAGIDPKDIEGIVAAQLAKAEQTRKEDANYNVVQAKLIENYGSNYQSVLKQQIDQLGLDKDFVNDLARKHPTVLFKTLGLDQPRGDSFQAPIQGTVRPDAFGSGTPKRTNAYYQKLRKDNPSLYRDPKIQDQMFKDALSLGDAFNDGDWNAYGH